MPASRIRTSLFKVQPGKGWAEAPCREHPPEVALWGGASSKSPPAPSSYPVKEAEPAGERHQQELTLRPQVTGLRISHVSRSVQQATLRAWAPGPSHRGGRAGGAWLWMTTEGQIYWSPWCHTWADCASCIIHVSSHQSHERRGMIPGPRPGADPRALPQESRGKAAGVHMLASTSHTVCHRSIPRSPTEDSTLGQDS